MVIISGSNQGQRPLTSVGVYLTTVTVLSLLLYALSALPAAAARLLCGCVAVYASIAGAALLGGGALRRWYQYQEIAAGSERDALAQCTLTALLVLTGSVIVLSCLPAGAIVVLGILFAVCSGAWFCGQKLREMGIALCRGANKASLVVDTYRRRRRAA